MKKVFKKKTGNKKTGKISDRAILRLCLNDPNTQKLVEESKKFLEKHGFPELDS